MPKFSVDIGDATYEVDAPDENTAWKWANATHTPSVKEDRGLLSGSVASQLKDAANAAGHHLMKLPHGIAQIVENSVNYGAQQLPDNPVSRYINKVVTQDNAAMKQWEDAYQASTPNTLGAYIGATAGGVVPFLLSSVAKPIVSAGNYVGNLAAKELPAAVQNIGGKIVSGATQGAIIGSTQPVSESGDYWGNKQDQIKSGLFFGGLTPVATKAIEGTYHGLKNLVQPLTNPNKVAANRLASTVGVEPKKLAALLASPQEYVPGSSPTTAQVIATPEAVQLEKALRNNPSFTTKLENVANDNNAARLEAVNSVAGQPGALEKALADRAATADDLYKKAFSEYDPKSVTPWVKGQLTILSKRPAMQEAIAQAKKDALNEGIKLTDNNSIQGLHYAKMALDEKIKKAFNDKDRIKGLLDTKQILIQTLRKLSPTYKEAMNTYAEMSKPVNTMEVGRQMQEALWNRPMNTGGDPNIVFQNYKSQLAKALKNSEYGIDQQAEKTLQAVQDDLRRSTISNGLKFPGSDTAYNTAAQGWLNRKIYGENFSGNGIFPKLAGGAVGGAIGSAFGSPFIGASVGAGAGLGISKLGASRVNDALAEIMASPKTASKALDMLSPPERDMLSRLILSNPMTQQLLQSAKNSP